MQAFLEGNAAVVGLQWGDEGKGKIVDALSDEADVVVRYCGGANAGHTVRFGGKKYSTHLLPVGVFRRHVLNLIGNGVVIDPAVLLREVDALNADGIAVTPDNLKISYKAHLVMPYHLREDAAREQAAEGGAIGTTRRGIGPCYADKMQRATAIRVADLTKEAQLRAKIGEIVTEKNKVLETLYGGAPLDPSEIFETYRAYGRRLAPFVDDVGRLVLSAFRDGKKILFEGAHAALLDVDHGTYPYVTSSSCSALGLFSGSGAPPQTVRQFIGVAKAYNTRVGGGPFPTELANETGDLIRERGHEYGTTTGRPRRIGWFDAVATRYASDLCGCTAVALTLLDVLSGLDELQICTGYKLEGELLPGFVADPDVLAAVEPVYETLPGWAADLSACGSVDEFPAEARAYVQRLQELMGVPIRLVSVGPDRAATLTVGD